jgi:hypothetical protein
LTHPTIDQLHQLGLTGMARAFAELQANPQSTELSHAEWLSLLLDREATERHDRRLRARLRFARLRQHAIIEDVDYRAPFDGLSLRAMLSRLVSAPAPPPMRNSKQPFLKSAVCICTFRIPQKDRPEVD